ncbi:MAG: hypothetical protein K2X27_06200, partial [Candidatus Obscuribacterales bacterium]|nr:hypothetical protein [Candidatus Obscuribacterales bacterium]
LSGVYSGLVLNAFDTRIISETLPQTKDLFFKPRFAADVLAIAQKVKERSAPLERLFNSRQTWYRTLPARDFFIDPETLVDREKYSDFKKKSVIDKAKTVFGSYNEILENTENFYKEEFALRNHQTIWFPPVFMVFAMAAQLIRPDFFAEWQDDIDCFAFLSHAASGYFFTENICFICAKPIELYTNDAGRVHRSDGPAAVFEDAYKVYAWKGINIKAELIENKNAVSVLRIKQCKNVETRRVMIDIYGQARFLQDAGANLIHVDECGSLYKIQLPGDEPLVMVKVVNSTAEADGSFKEYFLAVPPNISRAREAVAWTFNMPESEYAPHTQT